MSEMWQRIRAARVSADKTQEELGAALGLTRAGFGLWESKNPKKRTRPTVDQLRVVSKITGAPLEWLLDDTAELDHAWTVKAQETHDEEAVTLDIVPAGKACEWLEADAADRAGIARTDRTRVDGGYLTGLGPNTFAVRCPDDAMAPCLNGDDLLIVDPDRLPEPNKVVFFSSGPLHGARRLHFSGQEEGGDRFLFTLKALQEGYPQPVVAGDPGERPASVLGMIVGAIKDLT